VVSATHRNLEEMVRENTFRQDLYYRLVVFPIEVPALRQRREDIPLLAAHFMRRYAKEFGLPASGYSADALAHLKSYDWPGNVRELQNEIQRQLIQRGGGDLILAEDLSQRLLGETGIVNSPDIAQGTLKEMMNSVERVLLSRSLREHANNKTRAAQALGITREGLHKKLTRFGMV
jgi:Nif-specific regulatory protein